ncbi:hypothetical protein ACW4TU_01275 [Streptomyces sp. QTS52]
MLTWTVALVPASPSPPPLADNPIAAWVIGGGTIEVRLGGPVAGRRGLPHTGGRPAGGR